MKKNTFKSILLSLSVVAFLTLVAFDVARAEIAGLAVNTSVVMLRMEPGKELKFSFNVKNQTSGSQTIHLEERDIAIGNENAITFVDAQGGPSSWVTFEKNDFAIGAGETQAINASIQIPDQQKVAVEMMTMVSFASNDASEAGGPKVGGSIGVYTLLSGNDAQNATGSIEKISNQRFIGNSVDVSVQYGNIGDVQFVPQAKVSATNIFTKNKTEAIFDNHFVFPKRNFTFTKSIGGFSSFGAYKITASFTDGVGKLSERTSFAIGKFFPIVFIFAILFFLYIAIVIRNWRIRNSQEIKGKSMFTGKNI